MLLLTSGYLPLPRQFARVARSLGCGERRSFNFKDFFGLFFLILFFEFKLRVPNTVDEEAVVSLLLMNCLIVLKQQEELRIETAKNP
ncbi:hypothetical protein [Arsenophonus nasoniae]|uniref:hypothetical protein n=1 Tax=Arsenophonus nasoniae TaxID=638 RepID=UPI00387A0BC0